MCRAELHDHVEHNTVVIAAAIFVTNSILQESIITWNLLCLTTARNSLEYALYLIVIRHITLYLINNGICRR